MNAKIVTIAMIAIIAIGLTGLASAGSSMDYDVSFSGVGTGSIDISTWSPVGNDFQNVAWRNSAAVGHQSGDYNDGNWLKVDRTTRITGETNGNYASGSIKTLTIGVDPAPADPAVNGGYVSTYATYRDGVAGGSYVYVDQETAMKDNGNGKEKIIADTLITGYAYGTLGQITAGVTGVTDGTSNAATGVAAEVRDGQLRLDVDTTIKDKVNNKEVSDTKFNARVTAPGSTADGFISGFAAIDGVYVSSMQIDFTNAANVHVYQFQGQPAHFRAVNP